MSIDLTRSGTASLSARVAEEIRALMARQRKRQSEMARALGVSEQWVSVRLRGVQPIDLNDLERIAAFLEVDVTDLLPRSVEGRVLATVSDTPKITKGGDTAYYPALPTGQPDRMTLTSAKRRPRRGPVTEVPPGMRRANIIRSSGRLPATS